MAFLVSKERVGNMIIKLGTVQEANRLANILDKSVFDILIETATILDDNYGERNIYSENGGYIVIIDDISDLEEYKNDFDYDSEVIELIDVIEGKEVYISVLYMISSDYGITVFLPKEIATDKMISYMEVTDNEL